MIAQVTELTGSKNGIKIQVSWLKGRILSSTPQGGMRTEDGMDSKTKQGHRTGSGTNMEGLHREQHTMVPWGPDWGSEVRPGFGPWILCRANLLWVLFLSASPTQWTLFFSI